MLYYPYRRRFQLGFPHSHFKRHILNVYHFRCLITSLVFMFIIVIHYQCKSLSHVY